MPLRPTSALMDMPVLSTKQRALDDARRAHAAAVSLCRASSQPPPPYRLTELIGKGSFGRVYKAVASGPRPSSSSSPFSASPPAPSSDPPTTPVPRGTVVAVKVIDIERGDAAAPGLADTLVDLRAELRTLHALRGARNVNQALDALLVGPAVWLVVEHCAGGSVATLLRPTRDRGLRERWAVPVLRETAAALAWVHARGVIHRDVKAANVLVAEDGRGVQLCDFGVAATLRGAADKRSTVVGTPHAMAPELLAGSGGVGGGGCRYGVEVDVWAFGAFAYELATGRPPNAALGCGLARLGRQLQMETPRLVDARHPEGLKDLVARCLRREPAARPTMEEVCRHAYVAPETEERFPTASLAQLVHAFRVWEAQGGDRRSLFAEGGALGMYEDEDGGLEDVVLDWNFSTAVEADVDGVLHAFDDHEALSGAYGTDADEERAREEVTPRRRRRRPPRQIAVKSPLEKVFDANTLSNYDEYSRQYYGKFLPAPMPQTLLHGDPTAADRESIIDLDLCLVDDNVSGGDGGAGSAFNSVDLGVGTMRPVNESEEEEAMEQHVGGTKRATQDWKFPFAFSQPAVEDNSFSPHCWGGAASHASRASHSRAESFDSLIDLDMSAAPPTSVGSPLTYQRPRLQGPWPPFEPLPQVLMGQAGDETVKAELYRMASSLGEHLCYAATCLADLPVSQPAKPE